MTQLNSHANTARQARDPRSGWRKTLLSLATATVAVAGLACIAPIATPVSATTTAATTATAQDGALVNADSLRADAIRALKRGDFKRTQELVRQAKNLLPDDPALQQMDDWVGQFNQRWDENDEQRRENYEQEVEDVKALREAGFDSYALAATNVAKQYVDDDVDFMTLDWVKDMVSHGEKIAKDYEDNGQWLMAMRVWGDLAAIDEANPRWKEELQDVTHRVTLLATFTPERLEELRDALQDERDEVSRLILSRRNAERAEKGEEPLPDPTTRPADEDEDEVAGLDESFRTDWHDSLRGITFDMLSRGMDYAERSYVKPVELNVMLEGGLEALVALATTPGLEKAFPNLDNNEAREAFVTEIQKQLQAIEVADPARVNHGVVTNLLKTVREINKATLKFDEEVIVSQFADGAVSELDPFSGMIWPSQWSEFRKSTQGRFVGVGIQIRTDTNGDLKVVSPIVGGPAEAAGVRYGDVITHIDGKSAAGITEGQAVDVITGEPGTKVKLTVRGIEDDVREYELVRQPINVRSIKGWRQLDNGGWQWMVDDVNRIGYLRMTNFQNTTATEMRLAIDEMQRQGARGIILDLRYNPGGLLQSAFNCADQFLGDVEVVSTQSDRVGSKKLPLNASAQPTDIKLPLVVLINEYSASASEILSGALKDHDAALIVGQRSFGKGSVQMLDKLGGRGDDEAYMKLTTSHYYLPNGECIHKEEGATSWGVEPDVKVEMTPRQMNDAIRARQAMEVLRADGSAATVKLIDGDDEVDAEKALLDTDTQLSAALLLLRLELSGERVM